MNLRRIGLCRALLGLLLAVVPGCANQAFFWPDDFDHDQLGETRGRSRDLWFRAPGGPLLHGRWLLAEDEPRGTIVYVHGNNRNVSWHTQFCEPMRELGFDVFLFDARGYGRSEGRIDRDGFLEDTLAAVDLGLAHSPSGVIAYGRSLGSAAALYATRERDRVQGVVVEAGFARWQTVAARMGGLVGLAAPLLVTPGPDPVDLVTEIGERPVEVLHGVEDWLVPVERGVEIYNAVPGPRHLTLFEGVGHRSPAWARPSEFDWAVSAALHRILSESASSGSQSGE